MAYRLLILLTLISTTVAAASIVSESFDKLDLDKLPTGWRASTSKVSLLEIDGRGKVLNVNHDGTGNAGLTIVLDPKRVNGGTVSITALARCTKTYTPQTEKRSYANISVSIRVGGQLRIRLFPLSPDTLEWRQASLNVPIPKEATEASVFLGVFAVEAEVQFDTLSISVTGVPEPEPEASRPSNNDSLSASERQAVASLSAKGSEIEGLSFRSEMILMGLRNKKDGLNKSTYSIVGPGAPMADLDAHFLPLWKQAGKGQKDAQGVTAVLLASTLPEYLVAHKPEIVFLVGGTKSERLLADERAEWEDLIGICYRFGSIPVLVASLDPEQRKTMTDATQQAPCAVIDPAKGGQVPMQQAVKLIEKHILGRELAVNEDDE